MNYSLSGKDFSGRVCRARPPGSEVLPTPSWPFVNFIKEQYIS